MANRSRSKINALALTLALSIGTGGCAVPVILAVGAVGGYSVSRDTFEGITSKSQDELWDTSVKVASIMGSVESNDRKRGEISARISGANVLITIVPVNLTTNKLRIKARKGIFPRIGVAQEVYAKIMNQLEQ